LFTAVIITVIIMPLAGAPRIVDEHDPSAIRPQKSFTAKGAKGNYLTETASSPSVWAVVK
jgi:hypothetical protein